VLPLGHHTVYFPTQVADDILLPDGTDPIQWPGPPFVQRLWYGGSLTFSPSAYSSFVLNGAAATCTEVIEDATLRGSTAKESMLVHIDRSMALLSARSNGSALQGTASPQGITAMVERRDIVFMRKATLEDAKERAAKVQRVVKARHKPDFSFSLTPTLSLLFRFSALSFNAHRIHFDPQYAKEVEGHKNVLVHGPLTLTLMMSILESVLEEGHMVLRFDYRNLAPLYAEEEMKICVRKATAGPEAEYEVWIEGNGGGLAVRGYATVGRCIGEPV